ncbi:MAG: macro domain-containing protein [Nitriliruptorales bacterium]|nr:macro domain-containing protein [Nitriliruptorales bacterium]
METVERLEIDGTTVEAVVGDLTTMDVEAVVNAANKQLQHGGGLAGALASAGGPSIQEEADRWIEEHGPLEDGEAAVTGAGELPARLVIHTAGPVYDEGSDENEPRLREAVSAALREGRAAEATSIALPAVSAGIYGYPAEEATAIIADEVVRWVRDDGGFALIRLVGLDADTAELFAAGLRGATDA